MHALLMYYVIACPHVHPPPPVCTLATRNEISIHPYTLVPPITLNIRLLSFIASNRHHVIGCDNCNQEGGGILYGSYYEHYDSCMINTLCVNLCHFHCTSSVQLCFGQLLSMQPPLLPPSLSLPSPSLLHSPLSLPLSLSLYLPPPLPPSFTLLSPSPPLRQQWSAIYLRNGYNVL